MRFDLTDEEWALLEPLMPKIRSPSSPMRRQFSPTTHGKEPRFHDDRKMTQEPQKPGEPEPDSEGFSISFRVR
jgi:hypothetical protein